MDKQKVEHVTQSFPLVEALVLAPPEGAKGAVGICTNTSAAGQVWNDVHESNRSAVCALGSLIVSRDGGERMIINSLAHPALKYLVLFSEESTTFAPSTNLLLALMDGFEEGRPGNYIKDGVAASSHYPTITKEIFDMFRREITVVPAFIPKHARSKEIIARYLKWLEPKIDQALSKLLAEINSKDKIYYDSLNKLLAALAAAPAKPKGAVALDPKDFQHLQPPKIELPESKTRFNVPFRVSKAGKGLRLDVRIGAKSYFLVGDDPFLVSYSLMRHVGREKKLIAPIDQLLLGAELGRVSSEMANGIEFPGFTLPNEVAGTEEIPLEPNTALVMDKRYYYKVNVRGDRISVMCLAFDVCESVFELLCPTLPSVIERLARENRFEAYDMDILHRIDIGTQLGRAAIAAHLGYSFIQDFSSIFKVNTETLPSVLVDGDSFLDVHKGVLRSIYTLGITEAHGDEWKGMARTASVLAVYRNAEKALESMPALYRQGDQDPRTVRDNYKKELLRLDHDGTYTYGERTRSYFKFDQLDRSADILKKDPTRATIVQRFDPTCDMTMYKDPDTGKTKFTHDPCLTHDIFFLQGKRLHSFHIARAHNATNAYPENIFGLYDAYVATVRERLGAESGDMYMLSNRANILLLTEEQRAKKIMSEPSKPEGEIDASSGPFLVADNAKPGTEGGVAYFVSPIEKRDERPEHPSLDRIEDYEGVDTLKKAVDYLVAKGGMHNNPVLTEHYAGKSDPQADQLAFFQANMFGKKVYATAVFMNRSLKHKEEDAMMCEYMATRIAEGLGVGLGELSCYYVAFKN